MKTRQTHGTKSRANDKAGVKDMMFMMPRGKNLKTMAKALTLLALLLTITTTALAVQQIMGIHGRITDGGQNLASGNVRVLIYDTNTSGTLIYDSNNDFNNSIHNGYFDIAVGESTQLDLNQGTYYYLDMNVGSTNIDFNSADRLRFESPRGPVKNTSIRDGTIVNADISSSAAIAWTKISKTGATLSELKWGTDFNGLYARRTTDDNVTGTWSFTGTKLTTDTNFEQGGTTMQNGILYVQNLVIYKDFNAATVTGVDINGHQLPLTNNDLNIATNALRWRVVYTTDLNTTTASIATLTLATTLTVAQGGTGTTSYTTGRIPLSNGTILTTDGNLFWDNTNKRLGIGTSSPQNTLNVIGDINVTGNATFGNVKITTSDLNVNNLNSIDGNITFINTSGTELLRLVGSSGNVGIGASNPTNTLEVSGATRILGDLNFTGAGYLGSIFIKGTDINLNTINSRDGNIILVNNLGSERIRIESDGNTGIGATDPINKLDINGNTRLIGDLNVTGTATITATTYVSDTAYNNTWPLTDANINNNLTLAGYVLDAVFNASYPVALDTNTTGTLPKASGGTNAADFNTNGIIFYNGTRLFTDTNLYWDRTNKRLGIAGATSPQNKLNLIGDINVASSLTATPSLYIKSTDGNVGINTNNPQATFNVIGDVNLTATGKNPALYIRNTDGNIGIGTNTPNKTLHIQGDLNVTGKVYGGGISSNPWTSGDANIIYYNNSGDENVGIGTTTPEFKLDVNGTLRGQGLKDNLGWISNQAQNDKTALGLNNGGFGGGATPAKQSTSLSDINTFQISTVHANARDGSLVFDGRYIYSDAGGSAIDILLQYDTTKPLDSNSAWKTKDSTIITADTRFKGITFDGRYVYYAPGQTAGRSVALRYDTTKPFDLNSSWLDYNLLKVDKNGQLFDGAVFDGRYVYYIPEGASSLSGLAIRYDTFSPFDQNNSYQVKDITATDVEGAGFTGGIFDGRYVYYMPGGYQKFVRYDTTKPFDQNASWEVTFKPAGVVSNTMRGGAFDGKYIYFTYGSQSDPVNIHKFNITKPFDQRDSWETFNICTINASCGNGYHGAVFDGRYLYFTTSKNNGAIPVYDTTKRFDQNSSWKILDLNIMKSTPRFITSGDNSPLFDGKHIYTLGTTTNSAGVMARIRAWSGGTDNTQSIYTASKASAFYLSTSTGADSNLGIGTANPRGTLNAIGDLNVYSTIKKRTALVLNSKGTGGIWNNTPQFTLDANVDANKMLTVDINAQGSKDKLNWLPTQASTDRIALGAQNGNSGGGATPAPDWLRIEDFNGFTSVRVHASANAAEGGVFDGRYIYHATTTANTLFRYDTTKPHDSNSAWEVKHTTPIHASASTFSGAAFDGRYVYFASNGQTNVPLQYDTTKKFDENSSWKAFDVSINSINSWGWFSGAVHDGRYIYFMSERAESTIVMRYDTAQPFDQNKAWDDFNVLTVHSGALTYAGGLFDGRYIYLVPNSNQSIAAIVLRYDTTKQFDQNASWEAKSIRLIEPNGLQYFGAVFDGRYIYFINEQNSAGNMMIYDTMLPFDSNGAWRARNLNPLYADSSPGGYGGFYDGRYLYMGRDPSSPLVTYDTTKNLDQNSSWRSKRVQEISPDFTTQTIIGVLYDGKYVYYLKPSGNALPEIRKKAWSGGPDNGTSIYKLARSTDFFIDKNNNVGLGTKTPTGKLNIVGGDVNITTLSTNGAIYSNLGLLTNVAPSSRQYKEDIRPVDLNAERVLKLEPKSFVWKNNHKKDFGYIAQEVKETVPELYKDDGKTQGFDLGKLPFYIIELLKDREERLDGQEEAVRGQKQELAEQNKKLEEIRKTLCKYGKDKENGKCG